jgi:hypothetical protein
VTPRADGGISVATTNTHAGEAAANAKAASLFDHRRQKNSTSKTTPAAIEISARIIPATSFE